MICIGMGSDTRKNTLTDKKKEIFYRTYGITSLYVFVESLPTPCGFVREIWRTLRGIVRGRDTADPIGDRAKELAQTLADGNEIRSACEAFSSHTRHIESSVLFELKALLSTPK